MRGFSDDRAQSSEYCVRSSGGLASAAWTSSPKCSIAFASAGLCSSTSSSAIPGILSLPAAPYALFHYLSRGSATLALEQGREFRMTEGDFFVVTRGEPHVIYSDRQTKPLPVLDLERLPGRLGLVRHGGNAQPLSTMICGNFTVARPSRGSVSGIASARASPEADGRRRMARGDPETHGERVGARASRPGRRALPIDGSAVRRGPAQLDQVSRPRRRRVAGAMADPHIGPALQLIHERPDRPWTLGDLGQSVGLGRSAFSARFTKLVGQSMYRYLIARRMSEAAFLLETTDEGIARIATRVGYESAAAFSKLFHRHHGLSPGRYRADRRSDGGRRQRGRSGSRSRRLTSRRRSLRQRRELRDTAAVLTGGARNAPGLLGRD